MKPVQERLHIDELKRVEKQTNTLLKAWRTLNKNYRQLQEDYDKLNIRHNLTNVGAIVTTMTKRHGRQKEKH